MNIIKPQQYLCKAEIESRATEVVRYVQAQRTRPLCPIDATVVAETLGLDVEWYSIPSDNKGAIAAMIIPLERKIIINENIPELRGGFGESTLAHEIGHWELHIDQNAVGKVIERAEQGLEVVVEPFLSRSLKIQQGIEWQAQYFAGCLLMPRFILEEKRKGRNLTKWPHLYALAADMGVTISNLLYRLQDLGWIIIPKGSNGT